MAWAGRTAGSHAALKAFLAGLIRRGLRKVFEPGMVTTERVVEYPFVFQNLSGVRGPVLDVGCCHSRMPIALASRGYRVGGFDIAPYPYADPGLRAVQGDVMRLPFASRSVGAVLAISVIEHIGIGRYQDSSAMYGDRAARPDWPAYSGPTAGCSWAYRSGCR